MTLSVNAWVERNSQRCQFAPLMSSTHHDDKFYTTFNSRERETFFSFPHGQIASFKGSSSYQLKDELQKKKLVVDESKLNIL